MNERHEGWQVLDEAAGVLCRQYAFSGNGRATMMTFRGEDGGLVALSPATGLSDRDFDALREHGEVRALVATNTMHHLGQTEWRRRFPDAISYAPAAAIAALRKKQPDVTFRALSELALPDGARCDDVPGLRTGETVARIPTTRGMLWYAGDLLANMPKAPPPPAGWLFRMTESAPGFRLFKLAVFFMASDKPALRAWGREVLGETPPSIVVPAHGVPFDSGDVAEAVRAQFARI